MSHAIFNYIDRLRVAMHQPVSAAFFDTMLGAAFTVDLKEKLNGKVVVVDFWAHGAGRA